MSDDYLKELLEATKRWLQEVPSEEFLADYEKFNNQTSNGLLDSINNTIGGLHDAGVVSDSVYENFREQYLCNFSLSEESKRVWELSDQVMDEYIAKRGNTYSIGKHTYRTVTNLSKDTVDKMNFLLKQRCKEEGLLCDVRFELQW